MEWVRWDQMGWDGVGGMGQDGVGWIRMGWDGLDGTRQDSSEEIEWIGIDRMALV